MPWIKTRRDQPGNWLVHCAQVILAGDSETMLQEDADLPQDQQVIRTVAVLGRITAMCQGQTDVLDQLIHSKGFFQSISCTSQEDEEKATVPNNMLLLLYWRIRVCSPKP